MRRIRVAYLMPSLRPGGAEKQMLALAERLPQDRFAVDFLALVGHGEYDDRARAVGIGVKVLGSPPAADASVVARIARRTRKTMQYVAAARTGRYDIVDAWLYPTDVVAALLRGVTATPVVIGGRRNLGDFHDPFGRMEQRVAAFANRFVDAIVANSAAVAADVLRREQVDPGKVRIIRNGVALPAAPTPAEREAHRRRLDARGDQVLIGCVANYRPVKRLDFLIEAFGPVAREDPRAQLVLVGEGPQRPELERLIAAHGLANRVRLHGAALDPGPLYSAFDVVVQASRSEGLPNAMLEASAAGRAIVATDAGGTSEIVVDGRTGLLVPIDDGAELVGAMRRLVFDPALRARLGVGAREHVAAAFGMDRFVREFADLYEERVAAKRRGSRRVSSGAVPTPSASAGSYKSTR